MCRYGNRIGSSRLFTLYFYTFIPIYFLNEAPVVYYLLRLIYKNIQNKGICFIKIPYFVQFYAKMQNVIPFLRLM